VTVFVSVSKFQCSFLSQEEGREKEGKMWRKVKENNGRNISRRKKNMRKLRSSVCHEVVKSDRKETSRYN
jgi:hypothetical protein